MAEGPEIVTERVPSPIGDVVLRHDGAALHELDFVDETGAVSAASMDFGPSRFARAVAAYFAGELDALSDLPVAVRGTVFEAAVWQALRQIPVGHTWSYAALAASLGRPKAVRAVGRANGKNPIGLVLPCHRVIGADGRLVGYGGGLERKAWLLRHEGALVV
jgi:methylated-DNA-[protein]-cysteine S-methyltransferase